MTDLYHLIGKAFIKVEGGCLARQSLRVELTPKGKRVKVFIDSRWIREGGFFVARGTIERQRFDEMLTSFKATDTPEPEPFASTANEEVAFRFPLKTGHLDARAMSRLAFELSDLALDDRAFRVRRTYGGILSPTVLTLLFALAMIAGFFLYVILHR